MVATFQSQVNLDQTTGIPGEYAKAGPQREFPGIIKSTNAAANIFSRAFSHVAASDDNVIAGGTGAFAGLLMNPKEHSAIGTALGTLEPQISIPSESNASFAQMGIIYVTFNTTASIGQNVEYDTSTGANAGRIQAVTGNTASGGHAIIPGARVTTRNLTTTGQVGIVQLTA